MLNPVDMTPPRLLLLCTFTAAVSSCASKDDYDVNDPYGTPYGYADAAPMQPVNPVYDTPAAYEDPGVVTVPTPLAPSPVTPPTITRPTTVHTVVRGDTLWGLSRQYNVSEAAIKAANNMTRDTVVLGTRLQIPAR